MKTMVLKTGRQNVQTSNNITLQIETSVFFRVVNPLLAGYMLGFRAIQYNVK